MADKLFNSIADMLEETLNLPTGVVRALANFNVDAHLDRMKEVAEKDRLRVLGFVPAVLQRAVDLGVTVGYEIGTVDATEGVNRVEDITVFKSEAFDQLVREAIQIVSAYERKARNMLGHGGDPFKKERELTRIFAKRNQLNASYQELIGVGDATPLEYPEDAFK